MDMDNAWEKIKKGLKDGAALSMEKIEEYTKIGKLKIEEFSAKRKIERCYMDAGERVADLIEEGRGSEIENDLTVKNALDTIKTLREELSDIDGKICEVQEEAQKQKENNDDEEVAGV